MLIGSSELCMKIDECAIRNHHSQLNEKECQGSFTKIILSVKSMAMVIGEL